LDAYGIDFTKGQYFMANLKSRPTKVFDLTLMDREQVTDYYERMDAGVKAEDFTPSPSEDKCHFCSVSAACAYKA
jgi:putative RecB family exonuclease